MTTLQLNFVKTAASSKEELTLLALAPVIGSEIGSGIRGGYGYLGTRIVEPFKDMMK